MNLLPASLFAGRYRIDRELGRGGYGTVYLAEELGSGDVFAADPSGGGDVVLREVALKVLTAQAVDRHRFAIEVRALCRLNHPNIVQAFNFGIEPQPWVAMQCVDGRPLADRPLPATLADTQRTVRMLIAVADALAHAHAQGVVHRDLKPQNVLVTEADQPFVVDFGLSWLVNPEDPGTQRVGTAGYIAPERLDEHGSSDHRADIYGLGATIHAAFTGRSPFWSESAHGVLRRQTEGRPELHPALPPLLRPLVLACIALDPHDRPTSAARVADELRRVAAAMRPGDPTAGVEPRLDVLHATLRSIDPFVHATRGNGLKMEAEVSLRQAGPATEPVRIFVYEGDPSSASARTVETLRTLAPGTAVSFLAAKRVRRDGADDVFALDDESVVVVEPSIVLAVTNVARVEGVRAAPCATRALVDLRQPREATRPIVTGSLLHAMLEHLTLFAVDPGAPGTFDRVFEQAVRSLRIDLLAAGIDDAVLAEVKAGLRPQFDQLADWTAPGGMVRRGAFSETARLSPRYGLEGRIDLLLHDSGVLRVVELKSGKRESPDHEVQLRSYALMLDAYAEQRDQVVEPWLLYSQIGKSRRVQRRDQAAERAILQARNAALGAQTWTADRRGTPPPNPGVHRAICSDEPCRYRVNTCREQAAILGGHAGDEASILAAAGPQWRGAPQRLVVAARRYYFHFAQMVEREHLAACRELGRVLRDADDPVRHSESHTITPARIVACDNRTRRITLACHPGSRVSPGDLVLAHRGDFDAGDTFQGTVREVHGDAVVIESIATEAAALAPPEGWLIDRAVSRGGFRDMHRALYALLASGRAALIELLVSPPAEAGSDAAPIDAPGFNDAQRAALGLALGDDPIVLIQGPPGTGKTSVIAEVVAELVKRQQRVLVAAFTNTAVDTMLARIVRRGVDHVLRVGARSRLGAELVGALDELAIPVDRVCSGELERSAPDQASVAERLRSARVVAATTNSCAGSAALDVIARGLPGGLFDVVIVDEAAQLMEPLAVAALLRARRAVLVGDHRQLPPVIQAAENLTALVEAPHPVLVSAGIGGLDRSLFERLCGRVPTVMLTTQYRMNSGVQEFPSQSFYGGQLRPSDATAARRFTVDPGQLEALDVELQRRLDPARPAVWVDVGGSSEGNTHAREADEVARTIEAMLQTTDVPSPERVGVLSPYRAQCEAIRAALRARIGEAAELVEVDTVDRFQGREKEAVVISLVCSEWNEFVMDRRRLNVMLTRARTKVVVFGPRSVGRRMLETFAPTPSGPLN